jgi:DNA-binding NarL/FixJ family response regulator
VRGRGYSTTGSSPSVLIGCYGDWYVGPTYYSNVSVRILIADPQPFFARCVAWTLARDKNLEPVGWTTDEQEALGMIDAREPNLVLTEIDLDRGSGLELSRRVSEGIDVVVLTRRSPADGLLDAISAGALGWLGHDLAPGTLAEIIADRKPGRFLVDPDGLRQTLQRLAAARSERSPEPSAISNLTPREREVLGLVARGLDNGSIADALYLSRHTVRTHVGSILRKMGVHDRAEAARLALEASPIGTSTTVRLRGPLLEKR